MPMDRIEWIIRVGCVLVAIYPFTSQGEEAGGRTWKVAPRALIEPGQPGSFCETSVKDPSIVQADGIWHVFFTARGQGSYSIGYASAETLSGLNQSIKVEIPHIRGTTDAYAAAPQIFFYHPHQKWYLIHQTKGANYLPCYSTTETISDPTSWTESKPLLLKDDSGKWIDFWVICDESHAYLFYTRDHEDLMVRSTPLESFPTGWGEAARVFGPVHEAGHIYRVQGQDEYHLLYEIEGEDRMRSFGLARAKDLRGPWEQVSQSYATGDQLAFWQPHPHWTEEVSHGEFLRSGSDETLEYDSTRPCLLIQGIRKADHHSDYHNLAWRLGTIVLAESEIPSGFERRTFSDEAGTLSCLCRPGSGHPLVLIPGTFSDATQWNEVVSYLPKDLPLVLIDMRGHGGSWPPKPNRSIEELAQDTLWVLTRLGIEKAYFGGHSLGGMISKEIGRIAPERALGLIPVEGWTNHQAAKEAFSSDMASTLSPAQLKDRAEARLRVEAAWGKPAMNEFGTAWRRWDGFDFLKTTDLPILELYGDRNRPIPTRASLFIPDRETIQVVWMTGASHDLPRERPREVARAIVNFVNACRRK